MSTLEQNLTDALSQIEKEKCFQRELQEMYEESDKKLYLTIENYNKHMCDQEKVITQQKNKLLDSGDKINEPPKIVQHSQAQLSEPYTDKPSSHVLMLIAQLKHSQNEMEKQLKLIKEEL